MAAPAQRCEKLGGSATHQLKVLKRHLGCSHKQGHETDGEQKLTKLFFVHYEDRSEWLVGETHKLRPGPIASGSQGRLEDLLVSLTMAAC